MNQDFSSEWTKAGLVTFRLCLVYFVLYIIFVSQPFGGYYQLFNVYQYSGHALYMASLSFLRLINSMFLHRVIKGNEDISADTSWGYTIIISLFALSLIVVIIWSAVDNKKRYPKLFYYLHTLTRYYLAFSLLDYGISKIFWNQFFIPNWGLVTKLSDLLPQHLLWSFMAASRSYQFFGGLMEVIPALFLLFRRTSALGALLAIAVIVNVLMLNIGYDVSLKLILFHLLIFAVFVLFPNLKILFSFFLLNGNVKLATVQPIAGNKKRFPPLLLKFGVIAFIAFTDIKVNVDRLNERVTFPAESIFGMQEIQEFRLKPDSASSYLANWKTIEITPGNKAFIQYMNDSVAYYSLKSDTLKRSLELLLNDDTTFRCRLNYDKISSEKWLFRGVLKNDSVSFTAKKIDLNKTKLFNNAGKVKWVF